MSAMPTLRYSLGASRVLEDLLPLMAMISNKLCLIRMTGGLRTVRQASCTFVRCKIDCSL